MEPLTATTLSGSILAVLLLIERIYSKIKSSSCQLDKDGISASLQKE